MTPASLDFICYRQDTFAFAFQFRNTSGNPFDMSLLGDITMRVFRARNEPTPIFSPVLTELNSTVSGGFTPEQTVTLRPFTAYYELRSVYLPGTAQARDITLVNGRITTLDATEGQGVTDYISELTINTTNLSVSLQLGDSASIALQAAADAEGSATTATNQAGIATTQAGIATTQAGNALTQANRAEAEADIAQSAKLDVQNAVDADNSASVALEQVALIRDQVVFKGDLLVTNTEPNTPPTGFARIWLDGTQIKAKLSNGNNITLG